MVKLDILTINYFPRLISRTIEALGDAINNYKGGVILVSHDERLIRMVCKELWICGEGTVRSIDGGFDEYRRIVEKELEAANA